MNRSDRLSGTSRFVCNCLFELVAGDQLPDKSNLVCRGWIATCQILEVTHLPCRALVSMLNTSGYVCKLAWSKCQASFCTSIADHIVDWYALSRYRELEPACRQRAIALTAGILSVNGIQTFSLVQTSQALAECS